MSDQLLKTVRITDDMKVEVYQQGKKRKYALFYDSGNSDINRRRSDTDNTKSEKYDVAMSDDDVIETALKAYNGRFGTPAKKYYITQKTYSDPAPVRTYGNGDSSPYYLNNGCAINIKWVGQIPNPDFVLGTFSNVDDAEDATGIKSYLRGVTVTSTIDDADDESKLPSASWGSSYVSYKEATITLPKGFTENGGKGYLVWTNNRFKYSDDKDLYPSGTSLTTTILVNGNPVVVQSQGSVISHFQSYTKDSQIIELIISYFETAVSSLHGISVRDIGLKLCSPNNEACSLITYKSPLEPPNAPITPIETQPIGVTQSPGKIKMNIQGLFEDSGSTSNVFEIKAKTDMPTFTVWAGEIPKTELVDNFNDLEELDDEYLESDFSGVEETAGEFIVSPAEFKEEISAAAEDNKLLSGDNSTSDNGITVNGLAPNTPLPANSLISASFNGTPLYSQYDPRWAKSPFDWTPGGKKCGDNSTVSSSGCGPSAVSMVINFWASKGRCNPVTPAVVAKFFADFGGRVCGSGSGLGGVPKDKFKNTFGIVLKVGVKESEIMEALRKGYPCVISGKGYTGYNFKGEKLTGKYKGGHFVCLTGIDSQGRIRVNDSGNNPSGGKAITAFLEGKTPSGSTGLGQTAILYPSSMSAPV